MIRHARLTLLVVAVLVVLPALAATAQEKRDPPKKYAELVGTYTGQLNDRVIDLVIQEVDGKLIGAPADETPAQLVPVDGKDLTFTADPGGGNIFTLVFGRNDKKEIVKVTVWNSEMTLELTKTK